MTQSGGDPTHGRTLDPALVGQLHGWFNVVSGAWPLLSVHTFEAVFGEKTDRWLEYTVAGLLVTNGASQLEATRRDDPEVARGIGMGTALTLLAIDLVYVRRGTIPRTYLLDAVLQAGWLALWARTRTVSRASTDL